VLKVWINLEESIPGHYHVRAGLQKGHVCLAASTARVVYACAYTRASVCVGVRCRSDDKINAVVRDAYGYVVPRE